MYDSSSIDQRLEPQNDYKSKAEIKVVNILKRNYDSVEYEKPLFLTDRGSQRIWYPDFTISTTFIDGLVVEYAGLMECEDYAKGIRHKANAFSKNGLQAIFLYPEEVFGKTPEQTVVDKIMEAAERMLAYWENPPLNPRVCRKKKPDYSI